MENKNKGEILEQRIVLRCVATIFLIHQQGMTKTEGIRRDEDG